MKKSKSASMRKSTPRKKMQRGKAAAKKSSPIKVPPSRPKYSEAYRRKVVTYSVKNGIVNAAEKFGVSTPSVTNWRRTYGVTRETKVNANKGGAVKISAKPIPAAQRITTARRFTGAFRKEVAEFSISEGVARTAQRFGVSTPSVTNWRREFGINRQSRQKWLQLQSDNGIQKLAPANRREIEIMKKRLNQVVQQVDSWLDLSK